MKKWIALLLCLVIALSLTGCKKLPFLSELFEDFLPDGLLPDGPLTGDSVTVEEVYANVQEAMETNKATRMCMEISFGVTYPEGTGDDATVTSVSYSMLVDTISSMDPFGVYAISSMGIATDDIDMDIEVEVYMVEEAGSVVTYTKAMDFWSRTDSRLSVEDFLAIDESANISTEAVWDWEEMPANMTLDTEDSDVYILRSSIPADAMLMAFAEMGIDMEDVPNGFAMPVSYYVDKQEFTILRAESDMTVLVDLLRASMADSLLSSEDDFSELTVDISMGVYTFGYGPQEIPELPPEALDQTYEDIILPVEGEASDLGNGSYVLPCGSESVMITAPADWTGEVYDINNIWIYNEDQSLYGDFYYFEDWSEEDCREQVQYEIDTYKDWDSYISSGDGPDYDGFTTMTLLCEGESYCYAWTPMGDGYLFVTAADFTEDPDLEGLLNRLLPRITQYNGEFAPAPAGAEDLGDGLFSLPAGDMTFLLETPEGMTGEISSDNNIWFYDEEYDLLYDFYYWEGWTTEDILIWVDSDVENLKDEGIFLSQGYGPEYGDCETRVVLGEGQSYYYAWFHTDNGIFLAYLYDNIGVNDPDTMLPEMMDHVGFVEETP